MAVVYVKTDEDRADIVTCSIEKLDAIETTETVIAFRAYSKHDLEEMFSIDWE